MSHAVRAFLFVFCVSAVAGLLASTAFASGNSCSGSGTATGTIECSGTCTPGTCGPKSRPFGGHTAIFCGCLEGQLGWNCCYLLQWTDGPDKDEYFVSGDCPSCAMPGGCERAGAGTQVSPYTAACNVH